MTQPRQLITQETATELNQNYINSRSDIIREALGKDDADSAWFPLDEIENYLAYVKAEAVSKGYTLSGLRIYLGVYPDDSTHGDAAGMTTVFLSPTGNPAGGRTTMPAQSADITDIQPLNYGTMGHPPLTVYPVI